MIGLMERKLAAGIPPDKIAFVSFTKAAVEEAASRAMREFGLRRKDLPWFRTLHSLAFAALGASRDGVLTDFAEFGATNGYEFKEQPDGTDAIFSEAGHDNVLLRTKSLCAATKLPFEEVALRWRLKVSGARYERFAEQLREWKREKGLLDYDDMLGEFLKTGAALKCEVAFVDEAQDLTPVQWEVVWAAFRDAEELYVAGDDDQAIYHWAGAAPDSLSRLPGERRILTQSHRVPVVVKRAADSILARIRHRVPKDWAPRPEAGELCSANSLQDLRFEGKDSWLLVARAGVTLSQFTRLLKAQGLRFDYNGTASIGDDVMKAVRLREHLLGGGSAKKADVLAAMRFGAARLPKTQATELRKEDFSEQSFQDAVFFQKIPPADLRYALRVVARTSPQPEISVSTIHQAKGREAAHVVLAEELTRTAAQALNSREYSDAEHRAMYVGVTRARKSLRIFGGRGEFSYRVPVSR